MVDLYVVFLVGGSEGYGELFLFLFLCLMVIELGCVLELCECMEMLLWLLIVELVVLCIGYMLMLEWLVCSVMLLLVWLEVDYCLVELFGCGDFELFSCFCVLVE